MCRVGGFFIPSHILNSEFFGKPTAACDTSAHSPDEKIVHSSICYLDCVLCTDCALRTYVYVFFSTLALHFVVSCADSLVTSSLSEPLNSENNHDL